MIKKLDVFFLVALAVLALVSGLWNRGREAAAPVPDVVITVAPVEEEDDVPDFAAILDVKEKKSQFFAYMKELVDLENNRLALLRNEVQAVQRKEVLSEDEQQWLDGVADRYRLDESRDEGDELFEELLLKIDEIPVSLALVQAANESAWGTSRFALDANNYFGQWCFSPGCGLVPARRPDGATYEVQKFDSVADSVSAYMHNLNSSHHYEGFREMREKLRDQDKPVTGPALAHGLYAYSIRGVEYVNELIAMIEGNDLLRYDLMENGQSQKR